MKIHKDYIETGIQYWYDPTNMGGRSWWAALFDKEGNQIGEALYCHHRNDVGGLCRTLMATHNVRVVIGSSEQEEIDFSDHTLGRTEPHIEIDRGPLGDGT